MVHCYDPIPRHVNDDSLDLAPGEPEAVRRTLAEAVAGLAEKYPDVEVTLDAVPMSPADYLVEVSDHVGLVVVGSHRRSTLGRLSHLSTSRVVVEHARCTVAVVPEPFEQDRSGGPRPSDLVREEARRFPAPA